MERPVSPPAVIAMQNRCGSTWLCDMLNRTKQYGYAGEVPPKYRDKQSKMWDMTEYWPMARDEGRIIKLNWPMIKWLEVAMIRTGKKARDYKYVWLRRKDLWAQSVSIVVAHQFLWTKNYPTADSVPLGDRLLVQRHNLLFSGEQRWEEWFKARRIDPLVIWYENMMEEPEQHVRLVLNHYGVHYDGPVDVGSGDVVRTEHMIARAKELGEKYGRGTWAQLR